MSQSRRRVPYPAYWEYLYICIGVTALCGAVSLVLGSTVVAVLLLVAAALAAFVVRRYQARLPRRDNAA